jgi:DNA-binding transcriptional MerR regulator
MKNSAKTAAVAVQEKGTKSTYRSGTAARLAGLAVETLRVWERRYDLSNTERSDRGQRLYTTEQVNRLRLLKKLVDQGHAIGVIAALQIAQLEELARTHAPDQLHRASPIRVALVGQRLKERLTGRDNLSLDIRCNSGTLNDAMSVLPNAEAEVLVVEIAELDASALPLIEQARQAADVGAVVVMYRFCSSATIRQLRMNNCLVARVPADMGELLVLCRTALAGQRVALAVEQGTEPSPPRFDDDALTSFTTAANTVNCECPRHLAEILLMVGSFERYSAQCLSRNEDDAQLHQELGRAAGQARNILEVAMARLAQAEGLAY